LSKSLVGKGSEESTIRLRRDGDGGGLHKLMASHIVNYMFGRQDR
jgi:hypothetical protein